MHTEAKRTAVETAHAQILTTEDPTEVQGILESLYDTAVLDHEMLLLAYEYTKRIDTIGPDVVAERMGVSKEELVKMLHHMGDVTMSRLRRLSMACEVSVTYSILVPQDPDDTDSTS